MREAHQSQVKGQRLLLTLLLVLILVAPLSSVHALQPPALSSAYEARSARTYMSLEREFVKNYLFDNVYGGTYFSVDGSGNVLNSSKNIIFQTNIILFLAGMDEQHSDPDLVRHVDSAARFIVDHLRWGTYGSGTWILSTDRNGSNPVQMVPGGLAATEAYFSYALLWAYKITGNSDYFNVARTNLDTEMLLMPSGHILSNLPAMTWDVTYRSPERMAYYLMWQLTGNSSYLDFAKKVQSAALGNNGWEIHDYGNGTLAKLYIHGNALIDEVQYALVTGNESAINESRQRVAEYSAQVHDNFATGSDQGREFHQKLLAMDLGMWTITRELQYRDAAVQEYGNLLKFWDSSAPYGFWVSLAKQTKTCFSRGYPIADLTGPVIQADPISVNVTANIVDPTWQWLGLNYSGIGVDPSSVYLFYSLDGQDWAGSLRMRMMGDGSYAIAVPSNVSDRNPVYLVSASDYFNNTSTVLFSKLPTTPTIVVSSTTTPAGSSVPLVVASTTSSVASPCLQLLRRLVHSGSAFL